MLDILCNSCHAAWYALQLAQQQLSCQMVLAVPLQVTRQILTATGLIVVGCVLLVAFGSNSSNLLTVQQLLDLYKNHAYIAYLVVGGAVAAASFLLHCLGSRIVR